MSATWAPPGCAEALRHGPADGRGRCPWCGEKYTNAVAAPEPGDRGPSDLTEAYDEHYDPDHGTRDRAQIRRRYELGQAP